MPYKILRNRLQPWFCRHQMYFFGKFCFQLVLLVCIKVSPFNGIQNPVRNFRIMQIQNFFAAVFIIKRYSRTIFNSTFKIINGYITAKSTRRNIIIRQKRRTCKTNTCSSWQQFHHIIGKNTILAAVCFIRHNNHIMVRKNWLCFRFVKFLN